MAKDLISRYVWLISTIHRASCITFDEINQIWLNNSMSNGEPIPLRTFHNHRQAIEELFDINIECNKKNGYKYYIENLEDIETNEIRNWLLNTFTLKNIIQENKKYKDHILLETIPSGQHFLIPIIEAIRDSKMLKFNYQSFWENQSYFTKLEPYCLKVFRQRWYVIGFCSHFHRIKIFALDRITQMEMLNDSFMLPHDFNPQDYFRDCYGVIPDDSIKPEIVEIKVSKIQSQYIRSLPLHHSQKEIIVASDFSIFQYYLRPTFDFLQELLAQSFAIEVMSPQWFRQKIKIILEQAHEKYKI